MTERGGGIEIELRETPSEGEWQAILDELVAFNRQAAGDPGYSLLSVLVREDGRVVGGLTGRINYGWLFIEMLALPERLRGQGIGTRVLRAAEEAARGRGCRGVWLDTYGFQAPSFYRRNGYEVFGELPDCPPGSSRLMMSKRL